MNWTLHQLPSVLLCIWGMTVLLIAGNKARFAWALGFFSEFAWTLYAIWIHQYGLIVGAVFYAIVYVRNWLKWKPEG